MPGNFSPLDWAIVGVYLIATLAVGIFANRYIRGMSEFIVAGRSLKSRLSIATMIGSELGLVTVMFMAEKGFTGGFSAFHIGVAAGVVAVLVGWSGFIVVPLRELGVMTIPEFYERRFTRGTRIVGGVLLAAGGILNMGMFLKAGAVFVSGLTGLENPLYVKWIMTSLIVLVLVYTVLGGMVSIVITDYIQFVVLAFGLVLTCVFALSHTGWDSVVSAVETVHGSAGFDPFDADVYGWQYVVWMVFLGLVSCAVWQTAVLRACAAESTAVVRKLYVWSSVGFLVRCIVPQFLGICALAYFWSDPEWKAIFFDESGAIAGDEKLRAMPVFLRQVLPVGMIGLVAAGMLAAFMSTHDTYLLCWATAITEDVIHPATAGELSVRGRLLLTRIFVVAIAGFLLVWSLWYELKSDLWDYMAVTGGIYFTGAFVVLTAGIYWRRASTAGAYGALLIGSLMVFGLKDVQELVRGFVPAMEAGTLADWTSAGILSVDAESGLHFVRSETIGLGTIALAALAMIVGSLVFPGRGARAEGDR